MGGGKVILNDEQPPPLNKAGEETKKHSWCSLKTGDGPETVRIQVVVGRELGQSDRSWMEAGL